MAVEPEVFESDAVTRLRLTRWVTGAPLALLLAQLPWVLLATDRGVARVTVTITILATFAIVLAAALQLSRLRNDRRAEPGTIRVDRGGVRWNGRPIIPRTNATNGLVMPGVQTPRSRVDSRVRIARRWGSPIEFGVRDAQEGCAILRALGCDGSQVTASFVTRSRMSPRGWELLAAYGVGLAAMVAIWWALEAGRALAMLTMIPLCAVLLPFLAPTAAVVGTDGVLLKWLGTRRYIHYRAIARIEPEGAGVRFDLFDRSTILVKFGNGMGGKGGVERERIERDAFVTRVEQARASAPTPDTKVEPSAVARGDRNERDWLAALGQLARREGGMRTAPISRDQLFGLVNDPRLDESTRAGAAAALGFEAAPTDRERLRATAAMIASPKLRVAVEAAAEGDQKKLLDALGNVRDEARRSGQAT